MNIELLTKIRDYIIENPMKYSAYNLRSDPVDYGTIDDIALLLTYGEKRHGQNGYTMSDSEKLLDVFEDEHARLFWTPGWRGEFFTESPFEPSLEQSEIVAKGLTAIIEGKVHLFPKMEEANAG